MLNPDGKVGFKYSLQYTKLNFPLCLPKRKSSAPQPRTSLLVLKFARVSELASPMLYRGSPKQIPNNRSTLDNADILLLKVNLFSELRKSCIYLICPQPNITFLAPLLYKHTPRLKPMAFTKDVNSNPPDVSSPPSMTPSSTSPISREYRCRKRRETQLKGLQPG